MAADRGIELEGRIRKLKRTKPGEEGGAHGILDVGEEV
jgi:hypothetical protein